MMFTWTKVDDALPERKHTVLGVVKYLPFSGCDISKLMIDAEGDWVFYGSSLKVKRLFATITHWAEMPEMPRGGIDDDETTD